MPVDDDGAQRSSGPLSGSRQGARSDVGLRRWRGGPSARAVSAWPSKVRAHATHLLRPPDRLLELLALVRPRAGHAEAVADPLLGEGRLELGLVAVGEVADEADGRADGRLGAVLVGEAEVEKDEERVGVGQHELGLVAGAEAGHEARVGLEDALAEGVDVLDELVGALLCVRVSRTILTKRRPTARTGSARMAPACCKTFMTVGRYGSKPAPMAMAMSPKHERIGGLTLRCKTVLCRAERRACIKLAQ
jgi:hypothetical protein